MNEQTTTKILTDAGGKLWEKSINNGMLRRIYFNADLVVEFIGLSVSRYNTGNISGATLNGEKISNSEAGRILSGMDKIYYDLNDGKFHWTENYDNNVSDFCKMLRGLLNAEPVEV